jgi:hypothetical protein
MSDLDKSKLLSTTIPAMKNYVKTCREWKKAGKDVNGEEITLEIMAKCDWICEQLEAMGESIDD